VPDDLLVLDNYDSFTHNLVDVFEQLGARVRAARNDALSVEDVAHSGVRGVVISPGPGRPEDAGIAVALVRALGPRLPMLGVCLGHQALALAYGGRVVRARRPIHGSTTPIHHRGEGLLAGLPDGFPAARYHSLVVSPQAPGRGMRVTARSPDGEVMAMRHLRDPVEGVQFHPESYLTGVGPRLLAAFLRRLGLRPRLARRVVR
jgi:anthranilate synthase/aminodeoxychorismate synthase-like glutamine amidotransferase